jgi:hypothetical protein
MKKSEILSIVIFIAGGILYFLQFRFPESKYHFLENNHILEPVLRVSQFIIVLGVFMLGVMIFNFVVRGFAWFKPYFISKYNILTVKARYVQEIDLPKELLFKKLIEIMPAAGFKIKHTDENNGTIHASTPITWTTWGENIYISLMDVNGKSILEFYSTSIISGPNFRYISRERNERNYNNFLREFENSLVI